MQKSALKLAGNRNYFKPFAYPWAYDAFVQSEQMHWLWTEVPMMEDVKDFQLKLTDSERDFLTKILRFFTQGDIDVSGAYVTTYLPQFPQPEIRMMLSSFAYCGILAFDRDAGPARDRLQRVSAVRGDGQEARVL